MSNIEIIGVLLVLNIWVNNYIQIGSNLVISTIIYHMN